MGNPQLLGGCPFLLCYAKYTLYTKRCSHLGRRVFYALLHSSSRLLRRFLPHPKTLDNFRIKWKSQSVLNDWRFKKKTRDTSMETREVFAVLHKISALHCP